MVTLHLFPLGLVLVTVLVAAGTDLWNFRIPNALTIPFLISGLLFHAFVGQNLGWAGSLGGILVGTLPFALVYARGGLGAGDLKLLAGVGAWLGPWVTVHVLIISGLMTGIYSLVLSRPALQRTLSVQEPALARANPWLIPAARDSSSDVTVVVHQTHRRSKAIPFAVMVALGVLVAAVWVGV